jgi:hypothetical protein
LIQTLDLTLDPTLDPDLETTKIYEKFEFKIYRQRIDFGNG